MKLPGTQNAGADLSALPSLPGEDTGQVDSKFAVGRNPVSVTGNDLRSRSSAPISLVPAPFPGACSLPIFL